ncbi:carboxyl-terminal protease [Thalassoporum mexicanum PCC 7367]|uniref:S41 family peptidase n=1 Tax=Thalassoporum mexicanum TaxID=3457544 RepID=UPI00029F9847|nr:S41 family peptidase [Pseudanabaena sp. PCC 7367]AFY71272.1 carboxyl-terminal protease [Pseudanabaena sp. PCC 7367]
MVKPHRIWSLIVVLLLTIATQFLHVDSASASITDWLEEQRFITSVWKIVNRSYVDDTFNHQDWYKVRKQYAGRKFNSRDETYDAIQEMLESLGDPFTRLLRPKQYKSIMTSTSGALTGVGLQIAVDPETRDLVVVAPIEGSPADRAGLLSHDRIMKVNDLPLDGLSLDECANLLRGEIGTEVKLSVARSVLPSTEATLAVDAPEIPESAFELKSKSTNKQKLNQAKNSSATNKQSNQAEQEKNFDVTIVRERIEVNPVIAKLNREQGHKVGYVRLNQFNGNAAAEMKSAIANLEKKGADRYVLDLRGNPGGLLTAGVEIARQWLSKGAIVYTADRNGIQESFTAKGKALTEDPMVVLINGGTASASEILAGALHDNGRATLVGTHTFGKALIQSLVNLGDGSGIALTIAKYETPNHTDINKVGIDPDVEFPLNVPITRDQLGTKDDPQYVAALEVLKQQEQQQLADAA